jgi:uncharacterized membrane protein
VRDVAEATDDALQRGPSIWRGMLSLGNGAALKSEGQHGVRKELDVASTLAVIAFPSQSTAGEAAAALSQMQKDLLIDLQDVAWVTKKPDGKLKLHQATSLTGEGAAGGAMWGFLVGLLFFVPVFGMAVGAATGALAGHFTHFGIDHKWLNEVASAIPPGGSALFVMARDTNQDRVLPEMAKFGGTLLKTNLTTEQQQALEDALRSAE